MHTRELPYCFSMIVDAPNRNGGQRDIRSQSFDADSDPNAMEMADKMLADELKKVRVGSEVYASVFRGKDVLHAASFTFEGNRLMSG